MHCNMIRHRHIIFPLVGFWLAMFAAPAVAAAAVAARCTPNVGPSNTAAYCCCCAPSAAKPEMPGLTAAWSAPFMAAAVDPCFCSFQPAAPAGATNVNLTPPTLAAVVLTTRRAVMFVAPSLFVLLQAPTRGPSAAHLPPFPLAPDAGRAPPTA